MRLLWIDTARGFTVLYIPSVHVTMLFGNSMVYASHWGHAMDWIATRPGAQLLMMLMGLSFRLSHASSITQLHRSYHVILSGYLLNCLKFVVPGLLGWIPKTFFHEFGLTNTKTRFLELLLLGDILQFAGLSLLVLTFLHRCRIRNTSVFLMIVSISAISPYCWTMKLNSTTINECFSLITGNHPLVFFPLLPWLVFPLTGYLLAGYLTGEKIPWTRCVLVSLLLVSSGVFIRTDDLYRPVFSNCLYHIGFCIVWLFICCKCTPMLLNTKLFHLLHFCSKHITLLYGVQWVIICWSMAWLSFRGLNLTRTILWSIIITAASLLLTYFFLHLRSSIKNICHEKTLRL